MTKTMKTEIRQEELEPCPLCKGATTHLFTAIDENCRVSTVPFTYLQCLSCQCVFLNQPPADLGNYYQSNYYAIPALDQLQKVADKDTNKIDLVRRFIESGRLLEVGPAFGVFAWQAKQAGFVVDVIEMDKRCCDYLQNTLGLNVTRSDDPPAAVATLPAHDAIAIWHVLEHLPDPVKFLEAAASNLNPGGILVIAMPNPGAWQFKVMGRHWPHLDAPRHLTFIPEAWITRQASLLGLRKVFLTSDDSDARSWNRFGWQRLLMNRFESKNMQRVMYVLGYALSIIAAPFDRAGFSGSAYTVVFKK